MNQVPAHLLNRQGRNLAGAAVQGLGGNNPPHVSIARNRFTLVDAAGNEKPVNTLNLDVVICDVNQNVSKIYYDVAYDPSAADFAPPACFSDNGLAPSSQASKPQCATCAACPHNAWGSDNSRVTGKPTKACNDAKKIAVVVPGDDEIAYMLRVPPASLKLFKAYAKTIGGHAIPGANRNFDLSDIITRITFDPQTQGVLNFEAAGYYGEDVIAFLDELWADKKTDALVGRTDVPIDASRLPGGQPAPALAAPKPQMAPPAPPPALPQFSMPPAAQPQQAPASAQQAAPAPAARRGRPKKTENAGHPVAPIPGPASQPETDGIPPFLRRAAEPVTPNAPAPTPSFGMEQAPAPDAELAARINKAFALPT